MGQAGQPRRDDRGWARVAQTQGRAITWRQMVELTGDPVNARRFVRSRRWSILLPGVYATFDGPVPQETWWWALLLHAGRGATFGGEAALWLAGVRDRAPDVVEVVVPHERRVRAPRGCVVTRRRALAGLVHPSRLPPRLRVEEAVLDVADRARRPASVVDVVTAAVQRRRTTAGRLRTALGERSRHRWRSLLLELLADADAEGRAGGGVQSPLEHHYVMRVERAHGLPQAERNQRHPHATDGRSGSPGWRPDLRYAAWGVVVELDGLRWHPHETAFRDADRDNRTVVAGEVPLRYGWHDVAGDPCAVATQVARILTDRGWTGRPRRCGADCRLDPRVIGEGP